MTRLFIIITVIAVVLGYNKKVFSWGLFKLFTEKGYKSENLDRVMEFDPDRDILYLPKLEGKKLFQSIDDLSICRKTLVRKYIYIYLTRGRKFLIDGIRRSNRYMETVESVFSGTNGLPEDLKLLPLLESGFNPRAVSKSNAMGLWQFLSQTSKHLGLRINRWVDERRDIKKSTLAAARHLSNLYRTFNSWPLALAAYNGGGGYLKRALYKTGTTDIWKLIDSGELRDETSQYLPRFIALAVIYKNRELFGIDDEIPEDDTTVTDNYVLDYPVKLQHISQFSGITEKRIRELNPQLRMNITPPDMRNYSIRIPADAATRLEKNRKKLNSYRIRRVKIYRVRRGDSLTGIARRFKKNTKTLIIFNNIRNPDLIRPGRVIYIPYR